MNEAPIWTTTKLREFPCNPFLMTKNIQFYLSYVIKYKTDLNKQNIACNLLVFVFFLLHPVGTLVNVNYFWDLRKFRLCLYNVSFGHAAFTRAFIWLILVQTLHISDRLIQKIQNSLQVEILTA